MSNRHQELASPEQTASGPSKDFSNPLMADTLAIPEQTANTGKEISNPFMANLVGIAELLRCYDDDKD
ncbi:hypothetical protein Tco_0240089 [Tanacetum coccineum]